MFLLHAKFIKFKMRILLMLDFENSIGLSLKNLEGGIGKLITWEGSSANRDLRIQLPTAIIDE